VTFHSSSEKSGLTFLGLSRQSLSVAAVLLEEVGSAKVCVPPHVLFVPIFACQRRPVCPDGYLTDVKLFSDKFIGFSFLNIFVNLFTLLWRYVFALSVVLHEFLPHSGEVNPTLMGTVSLSFLTSTLSYMKHDTGLSNRCDLESIALIICQARGW
jgi:hypothetical protein